MKVDAFNLLKPPDTSVHHSDISVEEVEQLHKSGSSTLWLRGCAGAMSWVVTYHPYGSVSNGVMKSHCETFITYDFYHYFE